MKEVPGAFLNWHAFMPRVLLQAKAVFAAVEMTSLKHIKFERTNHLLTSFIVAQPQDNH